MVRIMNNAVANLASTAGAAELLADVILKGDLSGLSPKEKVIYYNRVCEMVGLNPLTKPFAYMILNGKEQLYASKAATDQLRKIHNISIKIIERKEENGLWIVVAKASFPDGRCDEDIGCVSIDGKKGPLLENLLMKAETKAKRRVTLSICGLGMLDESEVNDIPDIGKRKEYEMLPKGPLVSAQSESDIKIAYQRLEDAAANFGMPALQATWNNLNRTFKQALKEKLDGLKEIARRVEDKTIDKSIKGENVNVNLNA